MRRSGPQSPSPVQRSWHEVAAQLHRALEVLGWPVPDCLPLDRQPCGGTEAEHAATYLGALAAVVEHRTEHLHGGERGAELVVHGYADALAELAALPPCDREH
jgi:hypothetical protein